MLKYTNIKKAQIMYHTHPTTNTITFCTDLNFRFRYLYEGETHISSVILSSAQILIGYPNLINSIHGCCWQNTRNIVNWYFGYLSTYLVFLFQYMSVSDDLIVISDKSSSVFLISLTKCLEPGLSLVIPSSSPLMVSLVARVLHTYTSGGDILDIRDSVGRNS